MMQIVDLKAMISYPYGERNKNVFYKANEFKARFTELLPGGKMPTCKMTSYIIFYVIEGTVEIMVNHKKTTLQEGICLITEPAILSMNTTKGVKILAIQIMKNNF